jgi:excisionase family DNA binding protein
MTDVTRLPEVLTVDEIAGYLRVSKTTVCRWCSSGKLLAFRVGRGWRVQRMDLEQFVQSNGAAAPEVGAGAQPK